MKKILLSLSTIVIAAMMLASCNKSSPKDVAKTWLTSFYHMDYDAAKKVSTEETKNFISQLQALSGMMPDSSKKEMKKVTVNIKDVKEDGDKATVTYSVSNEAGKDDQLKLVKKDGKWLVEFSKNDSMGGDTGGGGSAGGAMGADSAAAAPVAPADGGGADTTKH